MGASRFRAADGCRYLRQPHGREGKGGLTNVAIPELHHAVVLFGRRRGERRHDFALHRGPGFTHRLAEKILHGVEDLVCGSDRRFFVRRTEEQVRDEDGQAARVVVLYRDALDGGAQASLVRQPGLEPGDEIVVEAQQVEHGCGSQTTPSPGGVHRRPARSRATAGRGKAIAAGIAGVRGKQRAMARTIDHELT